jgi:hypothetical protein
MYIIEASKNYTFEFEHKGEKHKYTGGVLKDTIGPIIDWLYKNGYKFEGPLHSSFSRRLVTIDEIKSDVTWNNRFKRGIFYKLKDTDKYIGVGSNIMPALEFVKKTLINFGIDESTIKWSGFDSPIDQKEDIDTGEIKPFSSMFPVEKTLPKEYKINPFRQSICVLGESGAGKSTTLEHILEFEGHEFEFIIPSASTTGLLSQFSPSRSGYIPSRLGKMIVEAFNNPTTLYTAVFDECHKSNVIEMINDELLQAISTKRNMGKRFISLDEDTSELYKGVDTFRGNILIPDNFGFIFISSKPRIIANNTDFFNRVELVLLTESDRDMSTSDELLSKVLPEEEKMKLASTRND